MFTDTLLVAVGAALGGAGRHLVGVLMKSSGGFPWSTFAVNVLGSLVLGGLSGWLARAGSDGAGTSQMIRCFAVVGVCGGFTTFSTFSNDAFRMLENSQWGLAAAYVSASVVFGLLAVFLGYLISR